jgi:hypothetical protein
MKVKVKIAADQHTAAQLRKFVQKAADAGVATTTADVATMAWLLEMAREINLAQADHIALQSDRGFEMVLPR